MPLWGMTMNTLRYSTGFIAGVFDGLGMIQARNRILSFVRRNGATGDGFDAAADLFVRG
jgi:hypothetical protein